MWGRGYLVEKVEVRWIGKYNILSNGFCFGLLILNIFNEKYKYVCLLGNYENLTILFIMFVNESILI